MVRLRRIGILFVLSLLLAVSVLASEECPGDYYVNSCVNQNTRTDVVDVALTHHYGSMSIAFKTPGKQVSEAYPAALFFLGSASTKQYANQFLPIKLSSQVSDPIRSPRDAVYLAWISSKYGSTALELETNNTIKNKLDAYLGGSVPPEPEQKFLFNVAKYVRDKSDTVTLTTLKDTLKANGGAEGWSAELEQNPVRMADVVIGLLALYDESPDQELRKLAEMHLDLVFTRFAAASVGGVWVSPVAGAMIANNAYTPDASPWHGWARLLFTNVQSGGATEPSLLVSGFCAHPVTRRIAEFPRTVQEKTASGKPLLTVVKEPRPDFFLATGAAQDIASGSIFESDDGYVSKAQLRTSTGAFIELNARTGTEEDTVEKDLGAQTVLFNSAESQVMLGRLEGSSCQEPHALVYGFDILPIANQQGFLIYDGQGVYVLLRYLGPSQNAPLGDRYAPRSNLFPNKGANYETLYPLRDRLIAANIPPEMVGAFAVEVIPSYFIDFLTRADNPYYQCTDSDIETCLINSLVTNTSFTYDRETGLTYRTKLQNPRSTWKTYTYIPGGDAKQGTPLSTNDYALRRVVKNSETKYLDFGAPVWTLQGSTGTGSTATVQLKFDQTDPALMKTTNRDDRNAYGCEQNPDVGGDGEQDLPPLGFIAANFLKKFPDVNYVIDCGPGTSILPNAALGDDLIQDSCVIEAGGEKTVALVYKSSGSTTPALESIFTNLGRYFPYDPVGGQQSITKLTTTQTKMCNAKAELTAESFDIAQCGPFTVENGNKGLITYHKLYAWVNGKENVIFISHDENPFTVGFADGLRDWFRGLFGGQVVQGETEDVESFDAAYFYHHASSGRDIKAILRAGHAEILVKNFVSNLGALEVAQSVNYGVQETTQYLDFDAESSDEKWVSLTRKLRIGAEMSGEPFSGRSVCGNEKKEFGEECDPPAANYKLCTKDPNHYVACNANCQLDTSACCIDADNDGYFSGTCAGVAEKDKDCVDEDPTGYFVRGEAGPVDCGTVTDGDGSPGDPCLVLPTSACPQCRNPGREIDVCCDDVDNDCVGGDTDRALCEPSCDTVTPPGDGQNSCEATTGGGDNPPSVTLTSEHGLTCDKYNEQDLSVWRGHGVIELVEGYYSTGQYASDWDRAMVAYTNEVAYPECRLHGTVHSRGGNDLLADAMDYNLDKYYTNFIQGGGWRIWQSGGIVVRVKPLKVTTPKSYMDWRLVVSVDPGATPQDMQNFARCWISASDSGWDVVKTDSAFDIAKVEDWATTNLVPTGDKMVKPCEIGCPPGDYVPDLTNQWQSVGQQGQYSFDMHLNSGNPEIRISYASGPIAGCDWKHYGGNLGPKLFSYSGDSPPTYVGEWVADDHQSYRIFKGQDSPNAARVFLKETDKGWQLSTDIASHGGGSDGLCACWSGNPAGHYPSPCAINMPLDIPIPMHCKSTGGGPPPEPLCDNVCAIEEPSSCTLDCEDDSTCTAACATTTGCTADPDCSTAGTCMSNEDCKTPLKPQCDDPDGDGVGTCVRIGRCKVVCPFDEICKLGTCFQILLP